MGDDKAVLHYLTEAAQERGFAASHLSLFPMPNVDDITAHLLAQDVVWVFGGSVAGLLAMWRLHNVGTALRAAWQAGVVLTGISAPDQSAGIPAPQRTHSDLNLSPTGLASCLRQRCPLRC
jgi:peptidase E